MRMKVTCDMIWLSQRGLYSLIVIVILSLAEKSTLVFLLSCYVEMNVCFADLEMNAFRTVPFIFLSDIVTG